MESDKMEAAAVELGELVENYLESKGDYEIHFVIITICSDGRSLQTGLVASKSNPKMVGRLLLKVGDALVNREVDVTIHEVSNEH